jgi:predicted nucleic acid-binding protein
VKAFFDSNVLVYLATSDHRKIRAAKLLANGGIASVQVLNEFANVARRKLRADWVIVELALAQFRAALDEIVPLSLTTHVAAMAIARRDGLPVYDALIVAAAIEAGCDTLYSEDLQNGRSFGQLKVVNPFAGNP